MLYCLSVELKFSMNIFIKILTSLFVFISINIDAKESNHFNDSIKDYIPFLQVKYAGGTVLPTTPIVQGNKSITWFNAASFRFGYLDRKSVV